MGSMATRWGSISIRRSFSPKDSCSLIQSPITRRKCAVEHMLQSWSADLSRCLSIRTRASLPFIVWLATHALVTHASRWLTYG